MPEQQSEISEREMLINLATETKCLGCGGKKRKAQSFCYGCYKSLRRGLQVRLYQRMGEGYEEAFREAMEILKGKTEARHA